MVWKRKIAQKLPLVIRTRLLVMRHPHCTRFRKVIKGGEIIKREECLQKMLLFFPLSNFTCPSLKIHVYSKKNYLQIIHINYTIIILFVLINLLSISWNNKIERERREKRCSFTSMSKLITSHFPMYVMLFSMKFFNKIKCVELEKKIKNSIKIERGQIDLDKPKYAVRSQNTSPDRLSNTLHYFHLPTCL